MGSDDSSGTRHPAWHDLAAPEGAAPEPPDLLPDRADVVVVGLGASGLEAIAELAARGADVVGLDAVGVAAGAAGANGGFLLGGLADFHHDAVARHGRDVVRRWVEATAEELDRLFDTEPSARRVGSLRIADDEAELADCREQQAAMRTDGLAVEEYAGPEGRGLLVPGDGAYDPVARCRRLAATAVRAGARLFAPARVTKVEPSRVTLAGGRLSCRSVLVAVDGGLETVVPSLAGRVRSARLQMLATAATTDVSLPRPIYARHGYDYAQQTPTGEVFVGGGRDLEGDAAWNGPAVPTRIVQDHLDTWAGTLGATAPVTHRWGALAGFTDDRLPIDVEVEPGVHVIGGYSGHGNVIGGLLGRRAAARILA